MSFVNAVPEYVAAAATDLANIGSTISSANVAALAPTSGVLAAGADEVSASIAALFGAHAQAYQALSAQAALFHQQFVQLMNGGAAQYAITEAANASPLQTAGQGVMAGVNAPSQAQTGYALTSNGAKVAPGTGANGLFGAAGQVGGTGGAGRLIGGTVSNGGIGPAAAAVGNSGWFGASGVGGAGSLAAGDNLGGVRMTGGNGGLLASAGAGDAAESAEELGIGGGGNGGVLAGSGGTPIAAVPAAMPVYSPATVGPAVPTPAHFPATAGPAESPKEQPAASAPPVASPG
jgi:PE family